MILTFLSHDKEKIKTPYRKTIKKQNKIIMKSVRYGIKYGKAWMLYVCQQVELFSTNLQDGNMEAMRQCRAAFIKRFAGLSFEPYQCSAGVWTIGYGHTGHLPDETPIADVTAISEE